MSGMSFEGIALTIGRYGSVMIPFSSRLHRPALSTELIYYVWQIYSTSRIVTIISLTIILAGIDDPTPYNCEVSVVQIYSYAHNLISLVQRLTPFSSL